MAITRKQPVPCGTLKSRLANNEKKHEIENGRPKVSIYNCEDYRLPAANHCVQEGSEIYNGNIKPSHACEQYSNKKENEATQLELITLACGNVLRAHNATQWGKLYVPRRNLLRKSTESNGVNKAKTNPKFHKNNFHLSLQNNWSKLVTNKISALAFSRSLRGHQCTDLRYMT